MKEAASLFQVCTKTIRGHVKNGMPHIRVGQQIRVDRLEALNWIKAHPEPRDLHN
ncbi:hypothetical protein D3C73_1401030 [compost metagenome]